MQNLRILLVLATCFSFFNKVAFSQAIPFEGNRKISIANPYLNQSTVTIYINAQSFSESQAKGHGSYARLLGGDGFFIELADHAGKLALYTGSAWWDTEMDIRSDLQDIFLEFNNGELRVFDGSTLVLEKRHRSKIFSTPNLHIGSKYHRGEYFDGVINFFCTYDRLLSTEEKEKAMKNADYFTDTFPDNIFDFKSGYHKVWVDGRFGIDELDENVGLIAKVENPATMRDEGVKVERVEMDRGGPPPSYQDAVIDPPKPLSEDLRSPIDIRLNRQNAYSEIYEGVILKSATPMDAGVYSLVIDKNGNVILKLIQKDK